MECGKNSGSPYIVGCPQWRISSCKRTREKLHHAAADPIENPTCDLDSGSAQETGCAPLVLVARGAPYQTRCLYSILNTNTSSWPTQAQLLRECVVKSMEASQHVLPTSKGSTTNETQSCSVNSQCEICWDDSLLSLRGPGLVTP